MTGEHISQGEQKGSFRPHFFTLFRMVSDSDIDAALAASINSSERATGEDNRKILFRLNELAYTLNLDSDTFIRIMPQWVNPKGFVTEIDALNSPILWDHLLTSVEKKDPQLVQELEKSLFILDKNNNGTSKMRIAQTISDNNVKFYQLSTASISFAALFGQDIERFFKEPHDDDKASFATLTVLPLALRLGRYFNTPASSIGELITRLQELFPENAHQGDTLNAFNLLTAQNSFEAYKVNDHNSDPIRTVCPASKFTRELYQGFGRLLHNPNYLEGFKSRVGRKSWISHITGN